VVALNTIVGAEPPLASCARLIEGVEAGSVC